MALRTSHSQIDQLEVRRLLAFAVFNPSIAHLNVTGTAADDTITVALNTDGSKVEVMLNGATESFDRAGVSLINIDAGGGNDTVSIQSKIQAQVEGGDGNDRITGVSEDDDFRGGAGNDTLDGGGGDDVLFGGDSLATEVGNDQLLGRGGDDQLFTGGGTDLIDGGSGSDTADFNAFNANLTLSLDDVANDGVAGQNPASNLVAIETVLSGQGDDTIVGSGANNSINGEAGADTIFGAGGNDTLTGAGDASIDGGSGDDRISGNNGPVKGEGGNDQIFVAANTGLGGLVDGGSGNDQFNIIGFGFTVLGQSGDDQISFDNSTENPTPSGDFRGGSGNDLLTLSLETVTGNDDVGYQITLDNVANDGVDGTPGTMNFHSDIESIVGSDGEDTLDATGRPAGTSIVGAGENDTITGSSFADTLDGQDGNDVVNAGAGNDSINSADGVADTINGGNGTDTATVDNGTDVVTNVDHVS